MKKLNLIISSLILLSGLSTNLGLAKKDEVVEHKEHELREVKDDKGNIIESDEVKDEHKKTVKKKGHKGSSKEKTPHHTEKHSHTEKHTHSDHSEGAHEEASEGKAAQAETPAENKKESN